MVKYEVRTCKPGDERALSIVAQAAILETYAPLVRGENLYEYVTEELNAARFRSLLEDPSMRLWAAEFETTRSIVGYAHALPDADDRSAMELKRIYLLNRFRGAGIGKRLLDETIAFALERSFRAILLRVHHKNEEAIGFYRRNGFTPVGEESFPAGDEVSTVVVMRLGLDGHDTA